MSKGVQIAIGALLIALLVGWFGLSNMDEYQYFQTLHEFQAQGREGERARVHGYVQIGSIERDLASKSVRFAIVNDPPHAGVKIAPAGQLAIVYDGLETPDLFKDGAEVVVEGHLTRTTEGTRFEATLVLAKCPSKFEAKSIAEPTGVGEATSS